MLIFLLLFAIAACVRAPTAFTAPPASGWYLLMIMMKRLHTC